MTLHYLKDQAAIKVTANLFGIAPCTVGQVVKEIFNILSKDLSPEFIKFPIQKEKAAEATNQFLDRFGFPHAIGVLMGHIYL